MTDTRVVELALHADRPAWTEVAAILAICSLLLVVLAKMDNSAARREAARAEQVLAEQAREAARNPKPAAPAAAKQVDARTESLGSRGPIAIPVGGPGAAWSPGTSASVAHTKAAPAKPVEQPNPEIRRIVGPASAQTQVVLAGPAPDHAVPVARVEYHDAMATSLLHAEAAPAAAAPARPLSGRDRGPENMLLVVMAGIGLMMSLAGATILGRAG